MSHMPLYIYQKGRLYSADCAKCGNSAFTHEWIDLDHNERRDAMKNGTLVCSECGGAVASETFRYCGRQYAGRYSASGYLDCTDWHYDKDRQKLKRELRDLYGI